MNILKFISGDNSRFFYDIINEQNKEIEFITNYYFDLFAVKEIQRYKVIDTLTIDNMIHSIAKLHSINWSEAEKYSKLQFYKICLFENILNENSKSESEC